ncbi:molybdopterin molybdotransferase MoeA [Pelagibius litoralis]|uniref:Molybdopterin molybdenumtransferase n=1 Tax=Pelagibius litoralis TaxID=374515 RepID=A0A967KI43_9PROT|nr:gephyrin-like molybdotransferase Glp [Pelagibius litoralis]NIA71911.1 molybdopterin molybdotransferase MoeA [Pelagibius litoralis]
MAQLTDDCFAQGGPLMRVEEARSLLAGSITAVTDSETVPLTEALGRILAEDIASPVDIPPAPNSAVDGYAVYHADLNPDAETRLPIAGRITAGQQDLPAPPRGSAIRIFTGARLPDGPDTVMMQEDCAVDGDPEAPWVVIRPGIKKGSNARKAGEDVEKDSIVLHRGQRLRAQDVGQAAAVGRREVTVSQRLRVALFSTGDELREPGAALDDGAIYDSNRYTIHALLSGLGCRVDDLGILPDRLDAVRSALGAAEGKHDLIVTSGGVSVGEEDHVKTAVEALGKLHLWRLAVKPGRPIALGQVGRVPFVGLPGNPVAVVVTFLNIVRPVILRMMGGNDTPPHTFRVRAGFDHKKKLDRREWVRARLVDGASGLTAEKFAREGAGILSSLVAADGLVELPEDLTRLEAGAMVDFLPFSEVTQ